MALNFPSPAYDGEIYVDPTSGSKYVYVAASTKWMSIQHVPVVISYGFNKANSAYLTANAAYDMANAAYNSQNVDYTLSNSAFIHANAAYDFSNSAYASINSNWIVQNALYTVANAAFAVANAALPNVSNAVFDGNLRVTGNLQIGSNTVTITNNHIIANDYFRMNTSGHMVAVTDGNIVNAVFDLVNVSFNTANASYASANNVGPQIAPTYNTANAAFGVANAAYGAANNVGPQIAPAFNTANAAFGVANTALQNTSGTLAGGLSITGGLGIGTSAPGVAGDVRVANTIYISLNNATGGGLWLGDDGDIVDLNTAYCAMRFSSGVQVYSGNKTGSAVVTLTNGGEVRASAAVTSYYSDIRLKTDIRRIDNALDKLEQLTGFYYKNNDIAGSYGFPINEENVGLSAQDVQKVLPQAVKRAPFDIDTSVRGIETSKSGENYLTVQYERIVPLLVEAINELRKEIKELKDK